MQLSPRRGRCRRTAPTAQPSASSIAGPPEQRACAVVWVSTHLHGPGSAVTWPPHNRPWHRQTRPKNYAGSTPSAALVELSFPEVTAAPEDRSTVLYLIHFSAKTRGGAQHYLGHTRDDRLAQRWYEHLHSN